MKAIIFDSGPLINLSMNGLLYLLESLKKSFQGKFLITEQVKYETIDRPIKIPRFELDALEIKELVSSGVLELPTSLNINRESLRKETLRLMDIANHSMKTPYQWINLVSESETSCLALSSELTRVGIENIIAIDERTTRILTEKPENLQRLMSDKLHTNIKISSSLDAFKNFRFIRSTELVYVAYKKGFLKPVDPNVLEAALYAAKYKGTAISFEEIEELKKL